MSRALLLGFAALASSSGAVAAFSTALPGHGPVAQPLAFNHRLHGANGLACADCHEGVESSAAATIPRAAKCMECHEEDDAGTPEKDRLKALAAGGGEIPWVRLYRLPAHVVFSHERHVALGKVACADCHGGHGDSEAPPGRPERAVLTMDGCLACHESRGASLDCIACHR